MRLRSNTDNQNFLPFVFDQEVKSAVKLEISDSSSEKAISSIGSKTLRVEMSLQDPKGIYAVAGRVYPKNNGHLSWVDSLKLFFSQFNNVNIDMGDQVLSLN